MEFLDVENISSIQVTSPYIQFDVNKEKSDTVYLIYPLNKKWSKRLVKNRITMLREYDGKKYNVEYVIMYKITTRFGEVIPTDFSITINNIKKFKIDSNKEEKTRLEIGNDAKKLKMSLLSR